MSNGEGRTDGNEEGERVRRGKGRGRQMGWDELWLGEG